MTDRSPLTLRQLQHPDDNDPAWLRAHISHLAEVEAIHDLHRLLAALGVVTVAEAEEEIRLLQAYRRTFSKLVSNLGGRWEE